MGVHGVLSFELLTASAEENHKHRNNAAALRSCSSSAEGFSSQLKAHSSQLSYFFPFQLYMDVDTPIR